MTTGAGFPDSSRRRFHGGVLPVAVGADRSVPDPALHRRAMRAALEMLGLVAVAHPAGRSDLTPERGRAGLCDLVGAAVTGAAIRSRLVALLPRPSMDAGGRLIGFDRMAGFTRQRRTACRVRVFLMRRVAGRASLAGVGSAGQLAGLVMTTVAGLSSSNSAGRQPHDNRARRPHAAHLHARYRAARIASIAVLTGSWSPITDTIPAFHARVKCCGSCCVIRTIRSGWSSGVASRSRASESMTRTSAFEGSGIHTGSTSQSRNAQSLARELRSASR